MDIVLASASPRRAEILRQWGVSFRIVPPVGVDEDAARGSAVDVATSLARQKAEAVRTALAAGGERPAAAVIGADTVVEVGGRLLGKPRDAADAREMLELLSGREHRVVTGLAVCFGNEPAQVEHEVSRVEFRRLPAAELEAHLEGGDWSGKAGAYGIQSAGAKLVAGFQGCYYNIVGLPIERLVALLARRLPALARPSRACGCGEERLQRGTSGC